MTPPRDSLGDVAQTRQALRELVEALDRRLPHVERAGESAIAAEAERLRALALDRLNSLDESEAIELMADEGGRAGS